MDFFDSICIPFHVFQKLGLSPFNLNGHQMKTVSTKIHRYLCFFVMAVQAVAIVLCFVFLDHIVYIKISQTVRLLDTITMVLIQLAALIVFWESFHKRFIQMDFLQKINTIDFICEYQIGINPNYADRRRTNIIRLIRWAVLNVSIFIANFTLIYLSYAIAYRWWIIIFVSLSIYSFRYYQVITYVDIIHFKYNQINKFINNLQSYDGNDDAINSDLVKTVEPAHRIYKKYKSRRIYEKLNDLRRVCRLLSSANQSINEMFQFSIPMIIVNDFMQLLINLFWSLRIFLENKEPKHFAVAPFLAAILNFHHFISIATVCHHATKEVSLFYDDNVSFITEIFFKNFHNLGRECGVLLAQVGF